MNLEQEKFYSSVYVNVELISIEWRKECSINNRCTQQRFQLNSNIFGSHEFQRIDYSVYSKYTTKPIFLHSYYENFHPYDLIISSKVIGYDEFFQIPIDCDESTPVFAYKNLQQSGENNEALLVLVGKCYTAHVSVKYYVDKKCLKCEDNEIKITSSALSLKNYFGTNYNNLVIILITLIIIFSLSSIILIMLIIFHCRKIVKYRRMRRLIYPISPLAVTKDDKIFETEKKIKNEEDLVDKSIIISKNYSDIQNEVFYVNYQTNEVLNEYNTSTKLEKMESVSDWIVSKNNGTTYLSDYESYKQNISNNIDDDNLSTASTSLFGGVCGSNPGVIV
uniref:Cadherin domain-containing protein n=1 Tax=Strongyloides papillosus TaxID=174720 RepID=A0A0N5BWZ7_STREA